MNIARGRIPALTALAAALAASAVAAQAADWSVVPLAQWTESLTLEGSHDIKPPFGKWEERDGVLNGQGQKAFWSTMLAPGAEP